MKILITGGAGFIGQHLARALADRGDEVLALDVLRDQVHANPERSVDNFPGAVLRRDIAVEAAWADIPRFDAIVHLAAETGTAQSMYERDRYRRVNVEGTYLAARAAAERGAPIVSLSSRAVYGEGLRAADDGNGGDFGASGDLRPSREDDPHRPVSFYGETKSSAETMLAEQITGRVPATIIRPQNVIGPGQALHNPYTGVLAAFLARLREGRELVIYGDGTQTRDFVHVDDLVNLITWNLMNPPATDEPRVINSGTGKRTTLTQLAEYAAAAAPSQTARLEYTQVHRAGDIDHACADLGRLGQIGAPLPLRSSQEAVADFIRASWQGEVAPSSAWDRALDELAERGLTGQ